jgi:hypothetical protein
MEDEVPIEQGEPPLSSEELVQVRWLLFGQCPLCRAYVKDWAPGPFNAMRYNNLHERGIDPLTGHMKTCDEKWRRA